MNGARVPIVLIGGPCDGETQLIPADVARSGGTWCMPWAPMPGLVQMMSVGENPLPFRSTYVRYRPALVDFADWPMRSVMDDGTLRYRYDGEG